MTQALLQSFNADLFDPRNRTFRQQDLGNGMLLLGDQIDRLQRSKVSGNEFRICAKLGTQPFDLVAKFGQNARRALDRLPVCLAFRHGSGRLSQLCTVGQCRQVEYLNHLVIDRGQAFQEGYHTIPVGCWRRLQGIG